MLRIAKFVTTCVVLLSLGERLCASAEPPVGNEPAETSGRWVFVEEDSWFQLLDEPTAEMEDALLLFHSTDRSATARAIRKAAVYINISARRADPRNRESLLRSVKELETLAQDVEAGRIQSQVVLEQVFARAHYALDRHHRQKAFEEWSKERVRRAGHYLRSATTHFQQAVRKGKRELSEARQSTLRTTKDLANKLIEQGGKARQRLGSDVERAGESLREFSEEIKPAPPERP